MMNDKESIIAYLSTLPDDNKKAIEFSGQINALVKKSTNETVKILNKLLYDERIEDKVQFGAFYTLFKYHHRNQSQTKVIELIDRNKSRADFKSRGLFQINLSTYYLKSGSSIDTEKALLYADRAMKLMPDHQGVLCHYAYVIVQQILKSVKIEQALWSKAYEAINKAIGLDVEYAKYYSIKGVLLMYKGKYDEAKSFINHAIDIEKSDVSDYAVRINVYQSYLAYVQTFQFKTDMEAKMNQTLQEIQSSSTELKNELKQNKIRSIEFLGFFAAVISFTIGSIQLVKDQDFMSAGCLIIILNGCLIIVYSVFRSIMKESKIFDRHSIFAIIMGVAMILAGYILKLFVL